ncbi:MAG: SGNH/GDSL hydrolase family protein [Pirellulales bacterium]|nr:SGNH/GDSL hydrolase family protein [Pirellulales bacterium]
MPPAVVLLDYYRACSDGWQPEAPLLDRMPAIGGWSWLLFAISLLLVAARMGLLQQVCTRIAIATVAFLIGVLVIEILLGSSGICAAFHLRPPHSVFEFRPDTRAYVQVSAVARNTHNAQGLRAPEMPPLAEARRVICLGGSTTECLFLDNADSWTGRLMSRLNGAGRGRYWVGSAGRSGYASGHHLRFVADSPLVEHTAAVVILVGVEDLMRHLMQFDAGDVPPPRVLRTCTSQLIANVWNARLAHGLAVDSTGSAYAHKRHGLVFPAWPTFPTYEQAVSAYRQRLRELIAVARRRRLNLVFVTQPVLWQNELSGQALSRLAIARSFPKPPTWKYLTPENLRRAIDQFNVALTEVALQEGISYVDAAAVLSGRATCFYDDYHFTREGALELAELVADKLLAGEELGQCRDVGIVAQQGWRKRAPQPAF